MVFQLAPMVFQFAAFCLGGGVEGWRGREGDVTLVASTAANVFDRLAVTPNTRMPYHRTHHCTHCVSKSMSSQ